MAWVVCQHLIEKAGSEALHLEGLAGASRLAGADPHLLREALEAGVTDEQVLTEAAHGRLPLSWATS